MSVPAFEYALGHGLGRRYAAWQAARALEAVARAAANEVAWEQEAPPGRHRTRLAGAEA